MTTQVSGSIRFNTDTLKMEIYRGTEWYEIDAAILVNKLVEVEDYS